jgi:hypothetical protein
MNTAGKLNLTAEVLDFVAFTTGFYAVLHPYIKHRVHVQDDDSPDTKLGVSRTAALEVRVMIGIALVLFCTGFVLRSVLPRVLALPHMYT